MKTKLRFIFLTFFILIFLNACKGSSDTDPDTDEINNTNTPPVAAPGNNQNVDTGSMVLLDGSASSDLDGDSLIFSWNLTDKPVDSTTNLTSPNLEMTSFTADRSGTYTISLTVSDGTDTSPPVTIMVVANISGIAPLASASLEIATALSRTPVIIEGAAVTYIKPTIGNDLNGFFIQAEQNGPAIFLRVDGDIAAIPSPVVIGDIISIEALTFELVAGRVEITGYSGVDTPRNSGYIPAALSQNVTNVTDLVSSLGDYTFELVSADLTITSPFTTAGTDFISATVETTGVTAESNLMLRLPTTVNNILGLENDCTLTINTVPMWRMDSIAQLSIWQASEATNINCPATTVISATAINTTQVEVTFSRSIEPTSITDAATQFIFNNGLTATSASVSNNIISITTNTQGEGTNYTTTVATSITDTQGNPIDVTANNTIFTGYTPPSFNTGLVINEIDYDQPGSDTLEFIEIYNSSVSAIDLMGITLVLVNGNGEVNYNTIDLTDMVLPAGEYLVVGNAGVANVDIIIADSSIQNGAPDGVRLEDTGAILDSISYEGTMSMTGEGATPAASDEAASADLSLCRLPNGTDTDDNSADFATCSSTPGAANLAF